MAEWQDSEAAPMGEVTKILNWTTEEVLRLQQESKDLRDDLDHMCVWVEAWLHKKNAQYWSPDQYEAAAAAIKEVRGRHFPKSPTPPVQS